jgi:cell division protein FtsL
MQLWESDMLEILNMIYSSSFLLTYATITAVLIVLMVVINVYDYYTIQKRFRDLDKKYKRSL